MTTQEIQAFAQQIHQDNASAYPRVLAERGQQYAAGWLAARQHIAEQLEASR